MNKKGQALIEFVIILPILLVIILGALDFGNILYKKYRLESSLDYVRELHTQGEFDKIASYAKEEKFEYNFQNKTISIRKQVKVNAPGLNIILGSPFYIQTKGMIYE